MSNDVLGSLARVLPTIPDNRLGLVLDLSRKLAGPTGEDWEDPLKKFLRKEPTWKGVPASAEPVRPMEPRQIIQWDETDLIIPAQPRFVGAEKFTKENPDIKFWGFGNTFLSWFGPITENEIDETAIRTGKLATPASFTDMTPQLGEKRILTCSQLYWMLAQQSKGEEPNGKNRRLLTNGRYNILWVVDREGIERAVCARWFRGAGCVDAYHRDYCWHMGCHVLSRK